MSDDDAVDEAKTSKKGKKGKGDKEKGGKSNLIPAVVLAVGLAAGGYFMGGSSDTPAAGATATTVPEPPAGEIATMDPLSVNLADGHFLKVSMALQLSEDVVAAEFMKGPISKAKDLLIEKIAGRPMEELSVPENRKKLKEELAAAAKVVYKDEVLDVYFTDFVMQ